MAESGLPGELTPARQRAILALLTERDVRAAAKAARVAERTLWRWLRDPTFTAALRQAEGDTIGDAVRALIVDLRANHDTMRDTRDNQAEPAAVRLRAAMALDNSLMRWRELATFEARLAALEEAIRDK